MPSFSIIKKSKPKKTFRVASIIGKFDLESENIYEKFEGNIELNNDWQIGIIVGKSGTGKTTIAKELFPDSYINNYDYKNESLLDDMPNYCSVDQIIKTFNSVGFNSPKSWLKSYSVLSNGEKMRVDLARAILEKNDLFVFDEYTSVIDRNIAKIGSLAIQKAIRNSEKKFIAVTCHFDIQEWLMPDWVFNTDSMTFQTFEGQKKNKPKFKFEIFEYGDKKIWKIFAKYHYLNDYHNNAAKIYIAMINDNIAGFISILHFPHPIIKNFKMVHRLVVLPEYQGVGIGIKLLNEVGNIYKKNKNRFIITTSQPALINSLKKNNNWALTNFGRKKGVKRIKQTPSNKRITASFELK